MPETGGCISSGARFDERKKPRVVANCRGRPTTGWVVLVTGNTDLSVTNRT